MYSSKPTYSIGEIAGLMDNEPEKVRDALVAAGVRMMLGGADADLSRWPASRVQRQLDGSILLPDIELVPSPDEVTVLADCLPQSWQFRLRAARMAQMLSAQGAPEYQRDEANVDAAFKRLDDANATLAMMREALASAPKTGDVGKIREAQAAVDIARRDVERAQTGLERLRGDDCSSPSTQEHYADQQNEIKHEEDNSANNLSGWTVIKPRRFIGYSLPLYRLLVAAHRRGEPLPSARNVVEAWRIDRPPEVEKVLHDGLVYYDANGDTKSADLEAIRKVIGRMTSAR
jgi:hypothetical protein